jgi:carbon-monoxide dehydrogenase large subunit
MNEHQFPGQIGRDIPRVEDRTLTRGLGTYTDDMIIPGQVYGYFVRSQVAHGILKNIDATTARRMPGVLGVYTAEDINRAGIGGIKSWIPPNTNHRDGRPLTAPLRPPLAVDRVRCVGEAVALVVAETISQAKDAAEAVVVDIDPLPAVVTAREALEQDAPKVHDDCPGNIAWDMELGDAVAVEQAFSQAAHVTKVYLSNNRVVANPIEPRSAIASYDALDDKWTIHVVGQGVLLTRNMIANDILKVPVDKVRIITKNVGGSFGLKGTLFVEYPAIMCAARALGRPVKWTDERSGSFMSDYHSRTHEGIVELALDKSGRFLAWRMTGIANAGCFLVMSGPIANAARHMAGVYRTPAMFFSMKMAYTNTVPLSALRGSGRPEGSYFMERVVDIAAAEMGIDPIELRRRNFVRAEDMPYTNPMGATYDCGDFQAVLEAAIKAADVIGFPARREASRKTGKLRGLGIGAFVEISSPAGGELGGIHFQDDGTVAIITGTHDHGQGHGSPFAQILSDQLGIPLDRIKLLQNDSDVVRVGGFTGGSRSVMASGSALIESSAAVVARGRKLAAHLLEAAEEDIQFAAGRFAIGGTDRSVGILELAQKLRSGITLPEGLPTSLDVHQTATGSYPSTYPNGCHVAEVEIDPETGEIRVVSYTSADDCGVLINPMIVEGQIHGGVMMGLGQALMEEAVFDAEGQLVTGSFMDYAMPRAECGPSFHSISYPVPTKLNPLGVKGCGEAGVSGALPSVMNAIDDALRPFGVAPINMPATPAKVWQAIQDARFRSGDELRHSLTRARV